MYSRKNIPAKRILKGILLAVGVLIVLVGGLFGYLTVTEYYPEEGKREDLEVNSPLEEEKAETTDVREEEQASENAQGKKAVRLVSWNIGYGALGDNADFFMDGGKGVKTADKARVEQNLQMVSEELKSLDPDVIFLQEIDRSSSRSSNIDETALLRKNFPQMWSSFANNFKVAFIPYPVPPIGKVDSGLLTLTNLPVSKAERIQLPCPFSWPVRIANLKRCVMLDRVSLDDGRELVLINLHLEAYDSGEGKEKQTQMLTQILNEEVQKGNSVIAAGDFNQIFSSADKGQFPAQEGKWQAGQIDVTQIDGDWQFCMDEDTPSCRSLDQPYAGADHDSFQYYLIDGFIVSGDIKVKSCETQDLGFVSSDHNPVVLEAEIPMTHMP